MSFVKSPVLTPADQDALQGAVIEVCENAFFVFVELCDPSEFAALVEQVRTGTAGEDGWFRASVEFHGASSGLVEVVLPVALGHWLVVSLLGLPPDAPLTRLQLLDGVGEFANMVCGTWLSKASETATFTLEMPVVAPMARGWTPLMEAGGDERASRTVIVHDMPMEVRAR